MPLAPLLRLLPALSVVAALPLGAKTTALLPLDGFADGIHHWRNSHHTTEYPRLAPDDVVGIANNLLRYQRANGGWRENEDPLRLLSVEEQAAITAARGALDASLDNSATCPQIAYLAGAYQITGDTRYRDAALHGLEYVFAAQHSSGGWPHSFPNTESYRGLITFADAVTPNVLSLLRQVAAGSGPFVWIEPALRARAAAAVARGDACVLKLQIRQGCRLTGWAGQYNPDTLAPALGRSFELPSITSRETIDALRYLMSIEQPSPEVVAAVEGAAAWLEASAITGWRLERIAAEPIDYQYHTSREDMRLVADPTAPRIWARFYDLETNEPVLANRGGQRVATLAEIERERRTGYAWYGDWPEAFLTKELPAWRALQPTDRCARTAERPTSP